MERFFVFSAILGSLLIFACSSKDEPMQEGEIFSSSSEEETLLSSSEIPSSSSEASSSSSEKSSSSSAKASSSSVEASSSSAKASSSSVIASSSSSAKSSSSSSAKSSSSSVAVSSSSSVIVSSSSVAATDPKENFHIYLAFGQSNMEGQNWKGSSVDYSDNIPMKYKQNVDSRFRVMTAVSGSYKLANGNEQRTQGSWYTAVPPLVRSDRGLSPVDYFGRTLVAGIKDENIKIGIIAVAVAGSAIEGLEKGSGANTYFNSQQQYMKDIAAKYDNNPYNRLMTLAKKAQEVGVIKGIIMHQGESGAASGNWAQKVKGIYDNLLSDLGLPANSVPFLAGEAYRAPQNNNSLINGLCNTMTANIAGSTNKVCHVISSEGCATGGDDLHFSYEGYEKLGTRYGDKMLELLYK